MGVRATDLLVETLRQSVSVGLLELLHHGFHQGSIPPRQQPKHTLHVVWVLRWEISSVQVHVYVHITALLAMKCLIFQGFPTLQTET